MKAKYPDLQLVSAAGPEPADHRFHFAWEKLKALQADIIDEHCYAKPEWFLANSHRYDHYDRNGPKVFMGEYAAQSVGVVSTKNKNNLECALAEAAYMTGLERNADVVRMASYAPLFANSEAWQWTPDLIWVDSLQAYPTPNYYVQQLYTCNRGDEVLPTQLTGIETSSTGVQSLYASATHDDHAGETVLKVINPGATSTSAEIKLDGLSRVQPDGRAIVLAGADPNDINPIGGPKKISPVESAISHAAADFDYTFPAYSMTVLRIKGQ